MKNLEKYTVEQLERIKMDVEMILEQKKEKHRNELWGKIIGMMREYEKEYGNIELVDEEYDPPSYHYVDLCETEKVGTFYLE